MIHFGIIYEMLFSKVQQNGYKVKIHYFQFIQKSFFLNAFDEVTSLVLWFQGKQHVFLIIQGNYRSDPLNFVLAGIILFHISRKGQIAGFLEIFVACCFILIISRFWYCIFSPAVSLKGNLSRLSGSSLPLIRLELC